MSSLGTVAQWSDEDGWGVIASGETPGGCWTHFSALEMPGYRSLDVGELVDFHWEASDQDGFAYRAVRVQPRRPRTGETPTIIETPTVPASAAAPYRSTLRITPSQRE
ncbi:cold shock domain-containing protein [Lacisediminihabitans sp. H27-G8]|uniref:cold shock domain-containing protein n=1 Tax=Lacisediminihabitans sp. H27-G8 TaxID=3111909 RepID=UPI0038FCA3D9